MDFKNWRRHLWTIHDSKININLEAFKNKFTHFTLLWKNLFQTHLKYRFLQTSTFFDLKPSSIADSKAAEDDSNLIWPFGAFKALSNSFSLAFNWSSLRVAKWHMYSLPQSLFESNNSTSWKIFSLRWPRSLRPRPRPRSRTAPAPAAAAKPAMMVGRPIPKKIWIKYKFVRKCFSCRMLN